MELMSMDRFSKVKKRLVIAFEKIEVQRTNWINGLRNWGKEELLISKKETSWNALQVTHHLIRTEEILLNQMGWPDSMKNKTIGPRIIGKPVLWFILKAGIRVRSRVPEALPQGKYNLEELAGLWVKLRWQWEKIIDKQTTSTIEDRIFFHPVSGRHNITQCLDFISKHMEHHERQLRRIKYALER